MKDYKQFIRQLPNSTIVCALGEFSPPTVAHELLIKTVQVVAEQRKSAHIVFTSPTELINEEKKFQFLKLMFPKTKFQSLGESFFSSKVKQLSEKYRKVVIIAGADQFAEFKNLKESVNVEIISIGTKDPDADNAKMKQSATKGLYEDFKKLLPSTIRDIDGRRLMNEMRINLNLDPVKEQLMLVRNKLREDYFKGKIFNVGELVESNGHQYEIIKRGSNHLLLKDESGELTSKWINDVKQIKEAVIQQSGTDKIDASAPEADTGAKQELTPKGKTKGFLTFYNYKTGGTPTEGSRSGNTNAVGSENMRTVREHCGCEDETEEDTSNHVGSVLVDKDTDHHLRRRKVKYHLGEETEEQKKDREEQLKRFKKQSADSQLTQDRPGIGTETSMSKDPFFKEEEIDEIVNSVTDEDIEDLYEEDEIVLVYEDTGEEVEPHEDEGKLDLMEVLSRQERLKGKIRLRRTSAKRGRSTKIALKRYSPPATINKRARRLAIKLMKKRMLRGRPYAKASVADRERMEKMIKSRKNQVNAIAIKLVPRIRKVEKARMSHGKVTKGSIPSVF